MKHFYQSKTLWVNVIAAVALFLQNQWGYVLPPGAEGYVLIVVNLILRLITKTGLTA